MSGSSGRPVRAAGTGRDARGESHIDRRRGDACLRGQLGDDAVRAGRNGRRRGGLAARPCRDVGSRRGPPRRRTKRRGRLPFRARARPRSRRPRARRGPHRLPRAPLRAGYGHRLLPANARRARGCAARGPRRVPRGSGKEAGAGARRSGGLVPPGGRARRGVGRYPLRDDRGEGARDEFSQRSGRIGRPRGERRVPSARAGRSVGAARGGR